MVQRSSRSRNRQLRKRLLAIENKLHQYGELGAEVALVIRFPGKESGYSYVTSEDFLERMHDVVCWQMLLYRVCYSTLTACHQRSHVKTTNKSADDVRTRSPERTDKPAEAAATTTPSADAAGSLERDDTARSGGNDRFFPEPPVFDIACCRTGRGS